MESLLRQQSTLLADSYGAIGQAEKLTAFKMDKIRIHIQNASTYAVASARAVKPGHLYLLNGLAKKLLLIFMGAFLYGCSTPGETPNDASQEEWIALFNGKDLSGWTPKFTGYPAGEHYKNTFRAVDSLLQVSYSEYDSFRYEFGHLFYEKPFSYYKIRAVYRMPAPPTPGGPDWAFANNGLMLHSQPVETMSLEQAFPLSIEFQLLGGRGDGDRPTGNLCTPGCHVILHDSLYTTHCSTPYSGPTYPAGQWVAAEAVVLGDSVIHHIVEGDTVLTYRSPVIGGDLNGLDTGRFPPGTPMAEGYIAIQAESHNTDFKSIEVLDLCGCKDPKALNYKAYVVKHLPERCRY